MRKPKMPLRCAYKGYCLIVKDDGVLCAGMSGKSEVFDTMRDARERKAGIEARGKVGIPLSIARCYIVPAEMWEGR